MSTYTVKQTTVTQLPQDLSKKQDIGDYATNDIVDNKLQSTLLNYTTNRILSIPQNVKYTFADGVLTIKAGTKLYIPNGFEADGITPKFDTEVLENDLTYIEPTTNPLTLPLYISADKRVAFRRAKNISASTVPDNYNGAIYNTTTNKIESYNNGTLANTMSLPICICTNSATSGNNIASIDQIFHCFGYIGSTAFALPGVIYQFADGKNDDGTLKSVIKTFDRVATTDYGYHISDPDRQPLTIGDVGVLCRTAKQFIQNSQPVSTDSIWYKPDTNETFRSNGSGVYSKSKEIVIANNIATDGDFKITSFEPTIVPQINSYTRSEIAGMSMPSGKSIKLTLGSNGARYYAPANGFFIGNFICSKEGSWFVLEMRSKHTKSFACAKGNGTEVCAMLPVLEGDTIILGIDPTATYTTDTTKQGFYFVYANGED